MLLLLVISLLLGNEYIKENKFEEALGCYSGAIEIDPTNPIYVCNRLIFHSSLISFLL